MYTRDDCLQSKITSSIRLSDIIKFKNDDDFSINLTHIYVDPDQNLQEYFKKIPEIEIIIIYKSNVKLATSSKIQSIDSSKQQRGAKSQDSKMVSPKFNQK